MSGRLCFATGLRGPAEGRGCILAGRFEREIKLTKSISVCPATRLVVTAFCVAGLVGVAVAQMNMSAHDMGQMKAVAPPETLPAPLKMDGIGNSHLKIKATPEAQAWFDQGLNLLHDFWDYESAKAFEQAVRVDPQCAMCYWGLSQALQNSHGTNGGYSAVALKQAEALKGHASKREQMMIEATALEQGENRPVKGHGRDETKESAATTLWRKVVDKDRDDPQGQIFLAESLMNGYDDKGEPRAGTKQGIAILAEALKSHPDDSALNHYWIHAMEPGNHPERAIDSAKKLASLAPASGHMVHMPGHIFYRTGDYAQAEHWFAASTVVDEAYMKANHVGVDDDWNYVHNLMYAIDNLMQEGKLQEATALSGKLAGARGELADTLYIGAPRDGMTRINTQLPIALRTGNWRAVETLLAGSKPDAKLENLLFLAGELKEFAAGMAAVESGDLAAAKSESNALDAALWQKTQAMKDEEKPKPEPVKPGAPVMEAVMPDAMAPPLLSTLSIMSLELRAAMQAADKDLPGAKKLFAQAEREEKALGYREPPMYIRPVAETEGLALLRAGDAAGSHEAYARALAERPNSGFALFGMARASEAAHNTETARAEYVKFLDAWRQCDAASPEMAHAQEYLAGKTAVAKLE
jgi:tetratricopeptide (TPR) repeat protein